MPEPQPQPQPPLSTDEGERCQFNSDGVSKSIEDSAAVLELSPRIITGRQVKEQYLRLANVYHPNKHYTKVTVFTPEEAVDFLNSSIIQARTYEMFCRI